jgi:hypothetical protein
MAAGTRIDREPDMTRWAAYLMIAIGIVHMIVLGRDALPELAGWVSFELWSMETVKPLVDQAPTLVRSGHAFWATLGSFAVPLIILGALVLWLDHRGVPIPGFVGWAVAGWSLVASLINQPSGFPVGIVIGALLVASSRAAIPPPRSSSSSSPDRS